MRVNLRNLCLLCFFIPIFTIIISFIWSANLNLISWCVPNFEGCTSISRVGRYEPVKYFFKPLMFIYVIFLYHFWKSFYEFLLKNKINLSKILMFLAYCSILFLVLYIIFLGEGKFYRFFRQVGIFVYIFFTVITQLFFSIKFKKTSSIKMQAKNYLFYYSAAITILGVLLFPLVISEFEIINNFKNIISWNYFLLTQLYFIILFYTLKKIK